MVAPNGRGIQRPIHVKLSDEVICPEPVCERLNSIHERSRSIPRFCSHVESAKKAKSSNLPLFQLSEAFLSGISQERADSIKKLCRQKNPIVMYFGGKLEDLKVTRFKTLYFSVAISPEERESYYSKLGRVLTKVFVGSKIKCECTQAGCCVHELITHQYIKQIGPHLLAPSKQKETSIPAPGTNLGHNPSDNANGVKSQDHDDLVTTDGSDDSKYPPSRKTVIERMIRHTLTYKRIPMYLKSVTLTSSPRSLIPSEKTCSNCKTALSEPIFYRTGKFIGKYQSAPVQIHIKQCNGCNTPYRYSDIREGAFNFNDNLVFEASLLETIFKRLTLFGHPISETIETFRMESDDFQGHTNTMREAFFQFMAMKETPLNLMSCRDCGTNPPIIVFDVKRSLCFDVDSNRENNCEQQYQTCSKMLETVSKTVLSSILGRKSDQQIEKMLPSENWLPILNPEAAKDPQPQLKRGKPDREQTDNCKPDHYPIKFDDLWSLAKMKTGLNIINGLLDVLKLPKKGTLKKRVERIIEHNTDHYSFVKKLVKIAGKSGGILSVMCPHGICVGFKVLYHHEGPSDYLQFLKTWKYVPTISIVDFAPRPRWPVMR